MPVYMVQAAGFGPVKIGTSSDPVARRRQLQTSMPQKLRIVRVLDGGPDEEKALHERFSEFRRNGEWFEPVDEMITGDLGLNDLPIPKGKREYGEPDDPKTARGRWALLRSDLFEVIGGQDALAKALGISPWFISSWKCPDAHLGALVALARQQGAPVALDDAFAARSAAEKEYQNACATKSAEEQRKFRQNHDQRWIEQHGRAAAWWPLEESSDEEAAA